MAVICPTCRHVLAEAAGRSRARCPDCGRGWADQLQEPAPAATDKTGEWLVPPVGPGRTGKQA